METTEYLMEHDEEAFRLELKTSIHVVERQALWAGLLPGMRVADIGCGPGKTTSVLRRLVAPQGAAVGIDLSQERINFARTNYAEEGLKFVCRDVLESLEDLGKFDFVWVRFFLEYFRTSAFKIVKNLTSILNSGGILCLVDLDHNCLNHYGMSQRLERTMHALLQKLEDDADFDPYVGRKLYSFLYDLGYGNINVDVSSHHLITGNLNDIDEVNWKKKVQVASKKSGYDFLEYAGGFEEFEEEFDSFFRDPRRFTYTPVICCRGKKP